MADVTHDASMSIGGHLIELRERIVKISAAVLVGSVVGFIFHKSILSWLIVPYQAAVEDAPLAFFRPTVRASNPAPRPASKLPTRGPV